MIRGKDLGYFEKLAFDKLPKQLRYAIIEFLLRVGANPNMAAPFREIIVGGESSKASPLWVAVFSADLDFVNLFLKYNADTSARYPIYVRASIIGQTALELAKDLLYNELGTVGYYLGMYRETEKIKNLKEIINSLENAMKKN